MSNFAKGTFEIAKAIAETPIGPFQTTVFASLI